MKDTLNFVVPDVESKPEESFDIPEEKSEEAFRANNGPVSSPVFRSVDGSVHKAVPDPVINPVSEPVFEPVDEPTMDPILDPIPECTDSGTPSGLVPLSLDVEGQGQSVDDANTDNAEVKN